MNLASTVASVIAAAGVIGGGMYKLGSGLIAMSQAVKQLVTLGQDHEQRIRALEAQKPAASPVHPSS